MIKKYIIIVNPTAGKGKAASQVPAIESYMKTKSLPYELILTKAAGHAVELAEKFCSMSGNALIAAGGDGTCNEVINGLLSADPKRGNGSESPENEPPMMGVLPIGRGNDFSFGMGLPPTLEEALEILYHPHPRPIDIGLVKGGDYPDGRYFGNGIGVGFDTIVGLEAAKMKHIHGAAGYAIGALKTIITYPNAPDLNITFNGKTLQKHPALVSIMNGKRMGGSFYMAPDGNPEDGKLNICMTEQGPRRKLLKALMRYAKGTQAGLDDTLTGMSAEIHLKAVSGGMAVHADGETICTNGTDLSVSCISGAVRLLHLEENI